MSKIFISYRREDSQHVTDRIYDRLVGYYGHSNVFKDVDSIGIGKNFIDEIKKALRKTDIFIVVIGENWVVIQKDGTRRIDNTNDFVRVELEQAMDSGLKIVPILVDNATMPKDLPSSIEELTDINALSVRGDPDFTNDVARLFKTLPKKKRSIGTNWLIFVIGVVMASIVYYHPSTERIKYLIDRYVSENRNIKDKNKTISTPKENVVKKIKLEKQKQYNRYITTIGNKMWQDEPYTKAEKKAYHDNKNIGKVRDWQGAKKYCHSLTLGGYSDWRLPTKNELIVLYNNKRKLKNVKSNGYWSSSFTISKDSRKVSLVSFYSDDEYDERKSGSHYVRCIRAGEYLLENRNIKNLNNTEDKNKTIVILKEESLYTLTLKPTPPDAKIQIMNIKPKYKEEMKLKKGKYHVRVSKKGYVTKNITITLNENTQKKVKLEKQNNQYITTIGNKMWQDEPYTKAEIKAYHDNKNIGKVRDWQGAKQYCHSLTLGGYSDWRLPTENELKNLYKHVGKLRNVVSGSYWSSTTVAGYGNLAWYVYFYSGNVYYYYKNSIYYVRCVRAGQ